MLSAFVLALALPQAMPNCDGGREDIQRIQRERITGSLAKAEADARRLLECPRLGAKVRLRLAIELAAVLDRNGLHHNTRPVMEAETLLNGFDADIGEDDIDGRALLTLALARLRYHAEMSGKRFEKTTLGARKAESLFRQAEDPAGAANAIHLLGRVELQKRNFDAARTHFDASLNAMDARSDLDRSIFLSDYHRHVGMISLLSGRPGAAVLDLEKSLALRDAAGSKDYGLFARTMLGSVLIDGGHPRQARVHLEEALQLAGDLPSPFGHLQATHQMARMHEALGEHNAAAAAYRGAIEHAAKLGVGGILEEARERLNALEQLLSRDPLPE